MFDIIGYWGVLTLTMMMPIMLGLWIFSCFTNFRLKELGGSAMPLAKRYDKYLNESVVGAVVIIGTIISALVSGAWVLHVAILGRADDTFIGWHSDFAEWLSPVSGFVLCFVALLVAYEMGLRAYIRVTNLVTKLEEKAE